MYKNGNGVKKDYAKAFELFSKAAAGGDINALYNLGRCYENGWGVKIDLAKAQEWYRKAAEKGQKDAMNALSSF